MTPPRPVPQPANEPDKVHVFRLDASELFIHDVWAAEHVSISGTEGEYFPQNLQKNRSDPLYGEASQKIFDGPYLLRAHLEWPEATPEASVLGMETEWPSSCWIPRILLEESGARPPHEGDILRFWKLPYFDTISVRYEEHVPGQGFFFEVIKVNDDGHLFDNAAFVAFRLDLKRHSQMRAEDLILSNRFPNDLLRADKP
jgi:hypothetical protein